MHRLRLSKTIRLGITPLTLYLSVEGEYLRSCARHTSRILALLPDERSMSAPITVVLN
jgi:hypothetical protein